MNKKSQHIHILITIIISTCANLCAKEASNTLQYTAPRLDLILPSTESRAKKSRLRKTYKKRAKKKTFSTMSYEELVVTKNRQVKAGNNDIAIKYLEHMMKLCNDVQMLGEHLIELADLLFDDGKFNKASLVYTEFTNLYPGNDHIEYALYRAVLCMFYCTLDAERDQTKTEETIALADTFLERKQLFTHYQDEVINIRTQCYHKLIESEFNICNFYVHKSSSKSASADRRLKSLREEWLDKVPEIEPRLIALEADSAEKQNDLSTATQKREELAFKFPETTTRVAYNKQRKSMADRF